MITRILARLFGNCSAAETCRSGSNLPQLAREIPLNAKSVCREGQQCLLLSALFVELWDLMVSHFPFDGRPSGLGAPRSVASPEQAILVNY
jgi:hypothetical protein